MGINTDFSIDALRKSYNRELLKGFVDNEKYDLVMGYAQTEKGAKVDELGKLRFHKRTLVQPSEKPKKKRSTDAPVETYEDVKIDYATGREEVVKYEVFIKEYTDKETELISMLYEKKIKGTDIVPNLKWAEEGWKYISSDYKRRLLEVQEEVLNGDQPWDIISFAQHVKLANVAKLEDKIITYGDPLLILAFAMDVEGADIDKLRKAIEKVGNTHKVKVETRFQGHFEVVDKVIPHVQLFYDKFGRGNGNEEQR